MTHTLASVWLKRKRTSAQAKSKTTNSIFAMPVVTVTIFFYRTYILTKIPVFNAERRFYSKYGGGIGKKSPARKFQLYAKKPQTNFLSS
jgi:hypothetical protein